MRELAQSDLAARLRALTPARVGLGRTGVSQQCRDVLAFQLSHARARDAVHSSLEVAGLSAAIEGLSEPGDCAVLRLHSAAKEREIYLQRPDLGRALDEASRTCLADLSKGEVDLAVVVADGLSALGVNRHAPPLLAELLPLLRDWSLAPMCIVEQGRVAIGDEIGELLRARLALVLIGERPGLSSPDSMGAYLTWNPRQGRTDAERVCISNIRTEGLSYVQAAGQLFHLLTEAGHRKLTGVSLDAGAPALEKDIEP